MNLFGPRSHCTQLELPYGTHHNSLGLLGLRIKGEDEDVFAEKESLEDEFGWEAVGHMGWKEAWQVRAWRVRGGSGRCGARVGGGGRVTAPSVGGVTPHVRVRSPPLCQTKAAHVAPGLLP